MATQDQINDITALYAGYFDRAPDPAGLQFWIDQIDGGRPFNTIAEDFAGSPEAVALYPYLTTPGVSSPAAFVTSIYANLFNRAPDAAGLAFWTGVLADGSVSVADMIEAIINGAVDDAVAGTFDQSTLENKILVGLDFAEKTSNVPNYNFDTPEAKAAAIAALDGVTNDPATVDAAKLEIDAYIADGANPGDTVTLTTGIDNIVATDGNDLILGVANNGGVPAGATFTTGDVINGGAGNDTVRIVTTQNTTVVPTLSNVENIDVQAFGGDLALNLATSTGVEKLSLSNGNGDLNATNVGAMVDLALNNTTAGTLNATYSAAVVTGAADEQNVALNSAIGNVTVNGIETMNVTATGAAPTTEDNRLGITANGLKTLNIDGSGDLHITGTLDATVKTVDASAATGDVRVRVNAAADVKVTGGSGDDLIIFNGGLTTADVVDGGAGFDTVLVTGGDYSLAANATLKGLNALTGVEQIAFNGGGGSGVTINGSTFTNTEVTHFEFNTSGGSTDTVNNATSAMTYRFGDNNSGDSVFNMKGGSTTLNIEMAGTDGLDAVVGDGSDANVDDITVALAGVEPAGTKATINITSSGDLASGNYNSIDDIDAVSGSTVNIDGATSLYIDSFVNNITVNASALTGDLQITGSEILVADVGVVGTSNTVLGQGVDTFTLGSGSDTIYFNVNGLDSGILEVSGPTFVATDNILHDTLINFTAGADGDVLEVYNAGLSSDYTALSAAVQASIDALAGAGATLEAAASLATGGHGDLGWTAFSFQGMTYALYEDAVDNGVLDVFSNGDTLVQLTGVSVADLTVDNFYA